MRWSFLGLGFNSGVSSRKVFLNAALEALTPLREGTQRPRSFTARSVASTGDVAGIVFFTTLLR